MNVDPSGTDLKGVWSSVKNWFKGVGNAIKDFFVENVYVGVHQPVYNGVTGAAVPDLQILFGLPWKENPISFKNDTFLYDKLNNVINFLVQTSQTFFEEVLPDFLINTVWKDWIVDKFWKVFCVEWVVKEFFINYVWNDIWKNFSEDKAFLGAVSFLGIASFFASPWVGLAVSIVSALLWFRTLFD